MPALLATAPSFDTDTPPPADRADVPDARLMDVLQRPNLRTVTMAQPHMGPPSTAPATSAATRSNDAQANLRLLARLRGGLSGGFTRAAAARFDLDAESLWRHLHSGSVVPLALLTCALGLDRAVFARILCDWQALHGGPTLPYAVKPLILSIFDLTPDQALQRLKTALT